MVEKWMMKENTFSSEAGLFCAKCGNPAEYYSFRGDLNAYHCAHCDNENIVEDKMLISDIKKYGFELKTVVVYW